MRTRTSLPPRLLPILYVATAHLMLALAFGTVAFAPAEAAGFFYHPRLIAIVHLVTLGWISLSILGALYIVGPMALRMSLPSGPLDYLAYGCSAVGVAGMAAHFWLADYNGMAWAGGMASFGILIVAARTIGAALRAPIEGGVKLHIALACLNVFGAAALGIVLGANKARAFLPGSALEYAYGHAHLAALGWAMMMIMGVGYRLLPMVLPSDRPRSKSLYASAILVEAGAVWLAVAFFTGGRFVPLFALAAAAGLVAFVLHVAWMRRHPRRPPAGLLRPDYGARHAMFSLTCAVLAAALGLGLAFSPTSDASLRLAPVYGVLGLVGFLSQMVVGIETRVLPWFAVYHTNREMGTCGPVPDPHAMPVRMLQAAAFYLWASGVPLLAAGVGLLGAAPVVAAGGGRPSASRPSSDPSTRGWCCATPTGGRRAGRPRCRGASSPCASGRRNRCCPPASSAGRPGGPLPRSPRP